VLMYLLYVKVLELSPACRIMPKPLTKLVAGSDLLYPSIERRRLFRDAAWPKPIDQNSHSVMAGRRLIGSFQSDVPSGDFGAHASAHSVSCFPWLRAALTAEGQYQDI
jgi:hypothetical protein